MATNCDSALCKLFYVNERAYLKDLTPSKLLLDLRRRQHFWRLGDVEGLRR